MKTKLTLPTLMAIAALAMGGSIFADEAPKAQTGEQPTMKEQLKEKFKDERAELKQKRAEVQADKKKLDEAREKYGKDSPEAKQAEAEFRKEREGLKEARKELRKDMKEARRELRESRKAKK